MKTNNKGEKLIKSYGFWMSLLSGFALVVVQVLSLFNINIQSKSISDIISGVLGCLVVAGVLTKPTANNDETIEEIISEEDIQDNKED